MNILEFISSLEALPQQLRVHARDKIKLANAFGLENPPLSVPYDVAQTYIPNRAMDGFMAQKILGDPTIAKEPFAHYAFIASAIFASQQVALRSGITERLIRNEYPVFVYRNLDETIVRIVSALDYVPLIVEWWQQKKETFEDAGVILRLLNFFKSRIKTLTPFGVALNKQVEQAFLIVSYEDSENPNPVRAVIQPHEHMAVDGGIGLLVMPLYGNTTDYIRVFERAKKRLTQQAVILIYDKRPIVDDCYFVLSAKYAWHGATIKHLTYNSQGTNEDYSLLALQVNYFYQH